MPPYLGLPITDATKPDEIDIEPSGQVKILSPVVALALCVSYIQVTWSKTEDEAWHGRHYYCSEDSLCLTIALQTPLPVSLVSWLVVDFLEAMFTLNPNDKATLWRVGEYTYQLKSTGEDLAQINVNYGRPDRNTAAIDSKFEYELHLGDVTTKIHYTNIDVGIRSTLLHLIAILRHVVWASWAGHPIRHTFPKGSIYRTPLIAPAAGSSSSKSAMEVEITNIGQGRSLVTYSDLEAGLRYIIKKLRVDQQKAVVCVIEKEGDGAIARITTLTFSGKNNTK